MSEFSKDGLWTYDQNFRDGFNTVRLKTGEGKTRLYFENPTLAKFVFESINFYIEHHEMKRDVEQIEQRIITL